MWVQNIKDRLVRWKKFFEAKLNHDTPSIVNSLVEPNVYEPLTEKKLISVIHKFKACKTQGEDGFEMNSSNVAHLPIV